MLSVILHSVIMISLTLLSVILFGVTVLIVTILKNNAECYPDWCHYGECHLDESNAVECHYAELIFVIVIVLSAYFTECQYAEGNSQDCALILSDSESNNADRHSEQCRYSKCILHGVILLHVIVLGFILCVIMMSVFC